MERYFDCYPWDKKELTLADYLNWKDKALRLKYITKLEAVIQFLELIEAVLPSDEDVLKTPFMDEFLELRIPNGTDPQSANMNILSISYKYDSGYISTTGVAELIGAGYQRCSYNSIKTHIKVKDLNKRDENAFKLFNAVFLLFEKVKDNLTDDYTLLLKLQE